MDNEYDMDDIFSESKNKKTISDEYNFKIIDDFKWRDLLYGLSYNRDYIHKAVSSKVIYPYTTVDKINELFIERYSLLLKYAPEKIELHTNKYLKQEANYQLNYCNKHPFYNLEQISQDYIDSSNPFYSDNLIKKSCKAAIFRVLKSKERKIHFLLIGFNFNEALNKENEENGFVKFTNSEFRLIYRIWQQSKQSEKLNGLESLINERIIFYKEDGNTILASDLFNQIYPNSYSPKFEKSTNAEHLCDEFRESSGTYPSSSRQITLTPHYGCSL